MTQPATRHIEHLTDTSEATLKRLALRVAGRKMANEIFDLLPREAMQFPYADAFIATMKALLCMDEPTEPDVPEPPINRLGQLQMVFGVHKGKSFDEIPLEYLDWLCRTQEDFYKSLRAYLKHPELKSRRGAEMPEDWL